MFLFTLLSRSYCHLCDEMALRLIPYLDTDIIALEVIDIDEDQQLEKLYGERVPVLLHGKIEICSLILDEAKLKSYIDTICL